jgi:hypothetical protein
MVVTNPRILDRTPYPKLWIDVDGETVRLGLEQQKPAILSAGLVYLGPSWEQRLPTRTYHDDGGPLELHGFSDHPAIVSAYRDFVRYINS